MPYFEGSQYLSVYISSVLSIQIIQAIQYKRYKIIYHAPTSVSGVSSISWSSSPIRVAMFSSLNIVSISHLYEKQEKIASVTPVPEQQPWEIAFDKLTKLHIELTV